MYYTDTDSIFVDRTYAEKYLNHRIHSDKLGFLKIEKDFDEICFISQKVYAGIKKDTSGEILMKFRSCPLEEIIERNKNKGIEKKIIF